MKEEEYYTIATFTLPLDFDLARLKLEAGGIPYRVRDEYTVQVDNFLSHAVGGVKLQVRMSDFDTARALLAEGGYIPEKPAEPGLVERMLDNPVKLRRAGWILSAVVLLIALAFFLAYLILG